MDGADLDLIRRIGVVPFLEWPRDPRPATTASLARATGVSVETARRRLLALDERGALRGREIWPNLSLLGLRWVTLHYRAPGRGGAPPDRLERVAAREGVLSVFGMVGGDACVDLCAPDDASLWTLGEEIGRDLGGAAPVALLDVPLPHVPKPMQKLDWRIVQALRGRAERDLGEVADELRVSRRTVKRRFDAMLERGAVDIVGNFDPGALDGHLVCYLLIRMAQGARRPDGHALARTFGQTWLAQWTPADRQLADAVLVAVAGSVRDATELQREAASLASVDTAELLLLDRAMAAPAWLEERIAAAASGRATLPAPAPRRPAAN